ncbi:MAG: NAD(P)H-quinone oxidoreductase [Alphaproteobacteria bacterium]|nr:NAD(P)H-quinone oxidoreductase [Alphaproteobacteria bacterium]
MDVIEISKPGEAENLKISQRPIPLPGEDEILIKVEAAGVNRPDILQRKGLYPPPPNASNILGLEVSGVIIDIGKKVEHFKINDRVLSLTNGGGYATYCVVPALQCLPIPIGVSMIEAAGIPETFFTVWYNLFELGNISSHHKILIHGGSSGIGTTAIQFAKHFADKIFTTVGNEEKRQACLSLGANYAINYNEQDFSDIILQNTNQYGVDIILDMVGGNYLQKNLNILAYQGKLIQIAFLKGSKTEIDLKPIMTKELIITGSTLRPQSNEQKGFIAKSLYKKIWPLINENKIKPIIFKTFPFRNVVDAHKLMESNQHIGKIILTMT